MQKFLNPLSLKQSLIRTSVFIACVEQLKYIVIEHVKSLYWRGFENGKELYDSQYHVEFEGKGKRTLDESLKWFVEHNAITEEEKGVVLSLVSRRNDIAHGLLEYLISDEKEIAETELAACCYLINKFDKWWIYEIEIPTDPPNENYKYEDVIPDEIQSMNGMLAGLLYEVFTGNDKKLEEIYHEYLDLVKNTNSMKN